eukprot:2320370-Pyramimonas_sp.AAC.2
MALYVYEDVYYSQRICTVSSSRLVRPTCRNRTYRSSILPKPPAAEQVPQGLAPGKMGGELAHDRTVPRAAEKHRTAHLNINVHLNHINITDEADLRACTIAERTQHSHVYQRCIGHH